MAYIVTGPDGAKQLCTAQQLHDVIATKVGRTSAGVTFAIDELIRKLDDRESIKVEEQFLGVKVVDETRELSSQPS